MRSVSVDKHPSYGWWILRLSAIPSQSEVDIKVKLKLTKEKEQVITSRVLGDAAAARRPDAHRPLTHDRQPLSI